jgi:hypothetical protein
MFKLLTDLKIAGIEVKYIWCDDSGENKSFYNACWSNDFLIKFDFFAPRTPQRNYKVERKFQTLYRCIRAVPNDAGLENDVRSGVWSECANTFTFLSNITSIKNQDKSPHQLLFKVKPKLPFRLRSFREMGVVTTKADIQGKLANCGTTCMFMGYSVDHSNDVFCMLNLKTRMIINSRDVQNWSSTNPQSEKDDLDDDLGDLILKPKERSLVKDEIQPEIRKEKKLNSIIKWRENS